MTLLRLPGRPPTGVELHDEEGASCSATPPAGQSGADRAAFPAPLLLLVGIEVGRLARTDGLTGVANRRAWDEELARAARSGQAVCGVLLDCRLDDAMEIAERLRTAQPEGTCSLGVAQWDGHEDMTALVARADRALYAAEEGGRNRCRADVAAPAESAADR